MVAAPVPVRLALTATPVLVCRVTVPTAGPIEVGANFTPTTQDAEGARVKGPERENRSSPRQNVKLEWGADGEGRNIRCSAAHVSDGQGLLRARGALRHHAEVQAQRAELDRRGLEHDGHETVAIVGGRYIQLAVAVEVGGHQRKGSPATVGRVCDVR